MLSFVFHVRMKKAINKKNRYVANFIVRIKHHGKHFVVYIDISRVIFFCFLIKLIVIHSSIESARGEIYTI